MSIIENMMLVEVSLELIVQSKISKIKNSCYIFQLWVFLRRLVQIKIVKILNISSQSLILTHHQARDNYQTVFGKDRSEQ